VTIASGTRLGPYEIVAPIGAGGMGEVYRARDTRLDRAVAVKILPAEFAQNAQFKLRFAREAKTISQLSHPNICTLYDVGENYIVMELLDGESLADRLSKGPLPLREVLKYGVQIAEALGKAHREGVVHRDLKPGNIMITKSGAKLLDFGLAKGGAPPSSAESEATVQKPLTQEGYVLGTFQYMAPEQLAGEEPDGRTDIFALGAVLYEMATGKRAFEGKTKTSLIAAIVSGDPKPMTELQPLTPAALEHVVKKCLAKDREDRWQSASDIAEELRWISEAGSQSTSAPLKMRRKVREGLAWSVAVILAVAVAVLAPLYWRGVSRKSPLMRFSISLPPNTDTFRFDAGGLAVSPDGSRVVISLRTLSSGLQSGRQLWMRSLDSPETVPLPETAGAQYPFWSADGKFIGFFAGGKLKKIAADGGPAQSICDAPYGRGGTWNRDGTILLVPDINSPIARVSSAGGTPTLVTTFDRREDVRQRWPSFLPDGQHFIYVDRRKDSSGSQHPAVMASSLDSAIPKQIIDDASNAVFVPPDWLVFSRRESLMAVRFDARNLRVSGEPVALPIGKVGYYPDRNFAYFATSPNGTLVYLPPNRSSTQMRWVDRDGRVLGSEDQPGYYIGASLSPDGKRVAFTRTEDGSAERADIWIHDIGGTTSRFTFDGYCGTVRWSPDGKRLFFASSAKGVADLYTRPISGSGRTETVSVSRGYKETFDISPDGKFILTSEQVPGTGVDLMLVSLSDHQVTPFVRTPATDWAPAFSPDGRWVAYFSTGQIYVRRFPDTGEQWQITTAGGFDPKWSRDGNAIFYTSPDGTVMTTAVRRGGTLNFDSPRPLFRCDVSAMPEGLSSPVVGVSNDAQRFLVVTKTDSREIPFQIVLNWPEMVKGR